MKEPINVLFITWDGPGSTYLESLFLPIFRILAQSEIVFHVIQFTWADKYERGALKSIFETHGFTYRSTADFKTPFICW